MTTIVSNGYYMIADKRTTQTSRVIKNSMSLASECENFKYSRPHITGYLDETTKLIPQPKTTYKNKKVLCIGMAGEAGFINYQLSLLSYMTMDQLLKLNSEINTVEAGCTFLFITEDFHSHKVNYSPAHERIITVSSFPPGVSVVVGSGGGIIGSLNRRMPGVFDKAHILSLFLFATNTDKGSSNCFDVYGTREAKYFCKIIPSQKEVQSRCEEVSKLLNFGGGRKTHIFNNQRKS